MSYDYLFKYIIIGDTGTPLSYRFFHHDHVNPKQLVATSISNILIQPSKSCLQRFYLSNCVVCSLRCGEIVFAVAIHRQEVSTSS